MIICVCVWAQVEINLLKARQSALQEEVQKLERSAQHASSSLSSEPALLPVTTSATTTTTTASTFLSHHAGEMDLSDVLWSQQEINRLSNEVLRLEAETSHWRRLAQVESAHIPAFALVICLFRHWNSYRDVGDNNVTFVFHSVLQSIRRRKW